LVYIYRIKTNSINKKSEQNPIIHESGAELLHKPAKRTKEIIKAKTKDTCTRVRIGYTENDLSLTKPHAQQTQTRSQKMI